MEPSHDTRMDPAVPTARLEEPEGTLEGGQPEAVLSVLEADQLVSAKMRTRFGRRRLSRGIRALLWGLRIYVLVMFVLVLIQVLHAVRGGGH